MARTKEDVVAAESAEAPKGKRGRPPGGGKAASTGGVKKAYVPTGRPRGRPKGDKPPKPPYVPTGKPRGRPPGTGKAKSKAKAAGTGTGAFGRGRPARKSDVTDPATKKRGRPGKKVADEETNDAELDEDEARKPTSNSL